MTKPGTPSEVERSLARQFAPRRLPAETRLTLASGQFELRPWHGFRANVARSCRLLCDGVGPRLAKRLRQLAAVEIVVGAASALVGRAAMSSALAEVKGCGYPSLSKRVVVACVVAQWATARKMDRFFADELIAEARKHVRFLRLTSFARTDMSLTLDRNERLLNRAVRKK